MARKRKKAVKPTSDDYGSDWRTQHMDGLVKEVRDRSGTGQPTSFGMKAAAECKLDAYWGRMMITWKQYQAGMMIRRLWMSAHMEARVTGSYGERIAGGGDWLAVCNDARKTLRKAMESLGGALQPVAYQVCCDDTWANARNAGRRGLPTLRTALDRLAEHFQITDVEAA